MVSLRVCIDVDDLDRGIEFYGRALGLTVARRVADGFAELAGAGVPIDLLAKPAGSRATPGAVGLRDYARHWTPVHLDVVVAALEPALARAVEAGAVLEQEVQEAAWGRMANLADPFGHGLCLLEYRGRGYDELI